MFRKRGIAGTFQCLLPRESSRSSSDEDDEELDWLRLRRRLRLRFLDPGFDLEREREEPELEDESESESESELDEELDEDVDDDLRLRLPDESFFGSDSSRSFSFAARILFAVPALVLNSSGTSTDGFPSAFSFARSCGFSSICVREGRETYGRVDLHSKMKWPVPRHFWQTVEAVARG